MPLHALGGGLLPEEVTVTLKAEDVLLPGFGLLTVTPKVPAVDAVPVAVSCVEDTKVVVADAPPKSTCAPFTKFVPVTLSVYAPAAKVAGLTLPMVGVGFHKVTALAALAVESAAETAVMVTVLGFGKLAGAV
jgi:hypothetical protein